MPLLDAALRGAVIALLLFAAAGVLRERSRLASVRVFALFAGGLIVQVASSLPAFEAAAPRLWQAPLVGISVGNAVLFWIFVQSLFDDDFALGTRHWIAWLVVAGVSAANCATGFDAGSPAGRLGIVIQRGAPLLFSMLAALAAASTWRIDLVEGRRRLRSFIVVAGIAYTVATLAARLGSPGGRLPATTAVLDMTALLTIVAVTAFATFRMGPSELLPQPRDAGEAKTSGTSITRPTGTADTGMDDTPWIDALQRVMRDERAYRTDGLTVASLAERLSLPEYRLRRLINRRLGHRNFNAFVNAYRLDDVRAALCDPARRALPVLTLALDAGFQSIGPFNRAFKEATGLTPTEFRRKNLADS